MAVPSVDAHRDQYAVAVAIQAAVMAKAARALITLHEGLHDDVRQDAGNDYGEWHWHPVGFSCDGLGNGQPLDAVVALGVRIAAVLLPISITRMMMMVMRLRLRRIEE